MIDVRARDSPWINMCCGSVLISPVALVALLAVASALVFIVVQGSADCKGEKALVIPKDIIFKD